MNARLDTSTVYARPARSRDAKLTPYVTMDLPNHQLVALCPRGRSAGMPSSSATSFEGSDCSHGSPPYTSRGRQKRFIPCDGMNDGGRAAMRRALTPSESTNGTVATFRSYLSPTEVVGREERDSFVSSDDKHEKGASRNSEESNGERWESIPGRAAGTGNAEPDRMFLDGGFQAPRIGNVQRDTSGRGQTEKARPGSDGDKSGAADMEEGARDSSSSEDECYNPSVSNRCMS